MNKPLRLLFMVLVLLVGVAIGYLLFHGDLDQCRRENAQLSADLTRAVTRGVAVETQLNLCREGRK